MTAGVKHAADACRPSLCVVVGSLSTEELLLFHLSFPIVIRPINKVILSGILVHTLSYYLLVSHRSCTEHYKMIG